MGPLSAFVQASRVRKAMAAYEKALDWQELFELVGKEGITGDRMMVIACRVAGVLFQLHISPCLHHAIDELGSKQRHVEAARVLLDYVGDVDEAIASLVRGSAWSEARRIVSALSRLSLPPHL
jgi:elongator complex protein 1